MSATAGSRQVIGERDGCQTDLNDEDTSLRHNGQLEVPRYVNDKALPPRIANPKRLVPVGLLHIITLLRRPTARVRKEKRTDTGSGRFDRHAPQRVSFLCQPLTLVLR
jgi:hypothetical protein